MNNGILTKGQLQNIVKFIYDVCKIVAGGGIITPLLKNESYDTTLLVWVGIITFTLFFIAVLLDGIADRMGR
mgnify:CR=1 FL=1